MGVRIFTKEHREKLSKAKLGKKHTEERKHKFSISRMGHPVSQETRDKISKVKKSKGLKVVFTEEWKENISKGCKNKPPVTEETRKNMSESAKNKPSVTEETKLKMSKARKGKPSPRKNFNYSKESKEKMSKSRINYIINEESFNSHKRTKPELKAEEILKKYNINYKEQYFIRDGKKVRFYDFYLIDYNMLIEIDGIYWHSKNIKDENIKTQKLKKIRINDYYKEELANKKGYDLLRIWEDELDKLEEFCNIMLFYKKTS